VALVDAMSQKMVRFCGESSGVHFVHERVVEILSEGSTLTNGGREKFALGCYKSILIVLCREFTLHLLPLAVSPFMDVADMFILASSNQKPRPSSLTSTFSKPSLLSPTPSPLSASPVTARPTTPPPNNETVNDSTNTQNKNVSNNTNTNTTNTTNNTTTTNIQLYTNAKLIAMVTPVLLMRCKEVLHRFVIDDRQSGQCPLPRYRLAEVRGREGRNIHARGDNLVCLFIILTLFLCFTGYIFAS
jgi:hypothetical protein